jgi:hypothetical protein
MVRTFPAAGDANKLLRINSGTNEVRRAFMVAALQALAQIANFY